MPFITLNTIAIQITSPPIKINGGEGGIRTLDRAINPILP